ncbi:amino acid/polyamine/organocation transporter (APC superfamily) [Mycoplasmopsis mustelae]|uniref:Amino acid/polyamine/organocation transporter (APC superfamily) n=1 Tax=Mycoplasmopsis mustelae TaxID=171289 RepID=A0A4R7UES4_9BACT|nr:APC family permease [Mycoplasmopsis mustelae]TDV24383.1 amino acid/polyamine/organocation transporter (APC superfamily) [Mycoplasmopsis mustelae]
MKKHFNERTFTFFTINFIVGLGFLTTISEVVDTGLWGYLIIGLCILTVTGTGLVFSRMGNAFKDHYGGSYSYARHLDSTLFEEQNPNEPRKIKLKKQIIKSFCYFVGWNQFLQSPVLSSISPLFLSTTFELVIPKEVNNFYTIIWTIRITAFVFFGALILVSTKGLNVNTKIIYMTSLVKWAFLGIGLFILLFNVISKSDQAFLDLSTQAETKGIKASLIFANVLLFIFAFAGIEDMASMIKDVEFKNFRKILFISLGIVAVIYLVFYTLLLAGRSILGTEISKIYYIAIGYAGTVIFVLGFIFNDIGYKITQTVATARKLIPLALDNHINPNYANHNKHGEYRNAIILTAIITFISMIILWLIPTLLSNDTSEKNPYFIAVINVNSVALLIEDALTTVIALLLEKRKQIAKIPLWEKIIYITNILWISTLVILVLVPEILGDSWNQSNTFTVVVYLAFILIGYMIKWHWTFKQKRQKIKIRSKKKEIRLIIRKNYAKENKRRKIKRTYRITI